jgi:hypothetical protein
MTAKAKSGVLGVIAGAVAETEAALLAARGEQLGFFEPAGRAMTAEEAAAERKGGRPKGATSAKTRDVARFLQQVGADPLLHLARWLTLSPEEMAARLRIKVSEAMDRQTLIAKELVPFVHAKLAPTDDQGRVAPSIVFQIGATGGAGSLDQAGGMPAWQADLIAQGVDLKTVENQALAIEAGEETASVATEREEKP